MLLKKICQPDAWIYCERYVDQRWYSPYVEYTEVKEEFRPRDGKEEFELPCFLVKNATVFTGNPSPNILKYFKTDKGINFFLHPEMFKEENPTIKNLIKQRVERTIQVKPTASTRTVVCKNLPFFLKLHLNKRISRHNRRLRASSVMHSILVSRDLDAAISKMPSYFAYLPETVGVIIGKGNDAIGMIVREMIPRPVIQEKRFILPYFALWSKDDFKESDPPLLVQLIIYHKENPKDFFLHKIIEPVIKSWVWAAKERGILLECHGQNTLLEFNDHLMPTRVVHRDFQSLEIDPNIRIQKNLSMPFFKHRIGIDDPPHKIEYSLVYDFFIGHHMFSHLLKPMAFYFHMDELELKKEIAKLFQKHFQNWEEYFPRDFYYKLGKLVEGKNESEIVIAEEFPSFRLEELYETIEL